jgi:hypothetical protein
MITVANTSAHPFVSRLEKKLQSHIKHIQSVEPYISFVDPDTPLDLLILMMRELHLEIFQYQPHTTEAVFTAVGRMPKVDEELLKDMILQQIEEVEHSDMSLRDYTRLGGNESHARTVRMSPESFAVCAVKRMLAEREDPASYLGFMYIFEALTMLIARNALDVMNARGFPTEGREFIDLHAVEDVRHTDIIINIIQKVVTIWPERAASIDYGFDCFALVYPVPVWQAAQRRANQLFQEQ